MLCCQAILSSVTALSLWLTLNTGLWLTLSTNLWPTLNTDRLKPGQNQKIAILES
jgi:hypothetical protein